MIDPDCEPSPAGRPADLDALDALDPAALQALRLRYAAGEPMTDPEFAILEADHAAAVADDRETRSPPPADWPQQRAALAAAARRRMRGTPHVRAAAEHAA